MQTKVIIRENLQRLEKFQTKTVLDSENGHKIVWKCPVSEAALPFINTIADREKASREYLKGHFDVLCGTMQDGGLKYDYLPYQSLQQIIEMQLKQNHPSTADKIIKAYVDKIKSLPSVYAVPKEFYQMIGVGGAYDDIKLSCLSRGLVDLTPRNILVNGEKWIVIDSEWSFDFPVPVIFVLFRTIREIAVILQNEVRKAASKTMPVVGIFTFGLQRLYVPLTWVKYITDDRINLSQMLRWEMGFQSHVRGAGCNSVGRANKNPRIRTSFLIQQPISKTKVFTAFKRVIKSFPSLCTFL